VSLPVGVYFFVFISIYIIKIIVGISIKISEGQVDSLIKLALLEEKKKVLLNEGSGSMVMSDLKNKIQARMKGSLKIGPKLKNYPTAIDIIGYSNNRSLTFFDNGDVKWFDGKKYTKGGKWDFNMVKMGKLAGAWLKNDKGVNVSLDDAINYPSKHYGTGAGSPVPNSETVSNSVWIDLGQKLNSYKPKSSTYFEGKSSHVVVYPGSKPEDKKQVEFKKDGTIWFTDKLGSVKNNGAKWDKKSTKDGKLAGGWLINNQGKKVSLGEALSEPEFNFGVIGKTISDDGINRSVIHYLRVEGIKFYNEIKNKCKLPELNEWKRFSLKKQPYFCILKNNPPSKFIAYAIKESIGLITDDEELAEAAFMAIKNLTQYNQVKYFLGEDPYIYVSKSIPELNQKFYEIPIQKSYERIVQSTISKKEENLGCKNVKLTASNPAGPKHNNNFRDIMELASKGAFTKIKASIPSDYGWSINNNIYPKPILYTQKEIDSCQIIVNKYPKDKSTKDKRVLTKSGAIITEPGLVDLSFIPPKEQIENTEKLNEMKVFNLVLSQQKFLIPKYCQKFWTKTLKYYDEKQILNPTKYDDVTDEPVYTPDKTKQFVVPYNELCKDFGGLWVFGTGSDSYQCFCRDYTHPYLINDLETKNFEKVGYVLKDDNSKVNFKLENDKSTNWSTDDNKIFVATIVSFAASIFTPTIIGTIISAGINLATAAYYYSKKQYGKAALEVLFAVVSVLNKIPGIKDMDVKYFKRGIRYILEKRTLPYVMVVGMTRVLQATSALSNGLKSGLATLVGRAAVKEGKGYNILINFVKESEKLIAKQLGLTKKNITALALDL
jgi:hypothetical protein